MTEEQLLAFLYQKAGFEKVNATSAPGQLRVMGRVRGRNNTARWLQVVERLITHSEAAPWNVDISKYYFVRGKLLYGWRIILQAEVVADHFPSIAQVIQSTPTSVPPLSVDEVSLNVRPDRNALRNGKGAQPTGTAVVGPAALRG